MSHLSPSRQRKNKKAATYGAETGSKKGDMFSGNAAFDEGGSQGGQTYGKDPAKREQVCLWVGGWLWWVGLAGLAGRPMARTLPSASRCVCVVVGWGAPRGELYACMLSWGGAGVVWRTEGVGKGPL